MIQLSTYFSSTAEALFGDFSLSTEAFCCTLLCFNGYDICVFLYEVSVSWVCLGEGARQSMEAVLSMLSSSITSVCNLTLTTLTAHTFAVPICCNCDLKLHQQHQMK